MASSEFALDCLLPTDGRTSRSVIRQALIICFPLCVVIIICIFWTLRRKRLKRGWDYVAKRCLLTAVVVCYVSYISLAKAAINVFYCVDVYDGTTLEDAHVSHAYWMVDTAVRCFEGSHLNLQSLQPFQFCSLFSSSQSHWRSS